MTTTAKGFTKYTNSDDMDGPAQINAAEQFLEDLIGESAASPGALPADGVWEGRIVYTNGALRVWDIGDAAWHVLTSWEFGFAQNATPTICAGSPSFTDVLTITATSHGGDLFVDWDAEYYNSASGANRSVSFRLLLDGTQIANVHTYDAPVTPGGNGYGAGGMWKISAPAAGSHTIKLQMNSSAASTCGWKNAYMRITES